MSAALCGEADVTHQGTEIRALTSGYRWKAVVARPWPGAVIAPAAFVYGRDLQAAGEKPAHNLVGERLHAAVGMVDDEPLARAQWLVRNDQRADGVVAGAARGVADDVGGAFRKDRALASRVDQFYG